MFNFRTQVSLNFTDENLYNNFILPYKANRELNPIIVRCLSAYFYNDSIRNQIEGFDEGVDEESNSNVRSSQDIINEIRESLAMQSFYSDMLNDVMQDGIDDFSNILNFTNKFAEENGSMTSTKSDYGTPIYHAVPIEDKLNQLKASQEKGINTPNSSMSDLDLSRKIDILLAFMATKSDFNAYLKDKGIGLNGSTNTEVKTEIQNQSSQVSTESLTQDTSFIDFANEFTPSSKDVVVSEKVEEPATPQVVVSSPPIVVTSKVEEPQPIVEPDVSKPVLGEAASSMSALLKTLI